MIAAASLHAGVQAQLAAAQAKTAAADSEVHDAERELSYTTVRAPVDGRIGNKNVEVGNRVQIGQTLLVVVEPSVWFEANFKETQLAHIRVGQAARVRVDAIPGHVFEGRVESIAPASGAEFALLPADNATGNFTKVVQRVPVKITLSPAETGDFAERIRPGLSATIDVQVR